MVTAAHPFSNPAEASSPHQVKVVVDLDGDALYFSRYAIPFPRNRSRSDQISAASGHLRFSARSAPRFCEMETDAAGARGIARTIARAGKWCNGSCARHETWIARRRHAGGRKSAGAKAGSREDDGQGRRDEIHFCHRRRGQFVRQRPGRGFARHAARSSRAARRSAKVRSVSERRSRNDEPVPARRSLRARTTAPRPISTSAITSASPTASSRGTTI